MATVYGILGQTDDASTEVTLYTVPASKNVKFYINICNRAAVAGTFRLALIMGGGATTNEDYIYYDEAIGANASARSEILVLTAGDVVRAESSSANMTFIVYGIEVDA